jgi:hypothetical protein
MDERYDRRIIEEVAAFHDTEPRELEYAVGDYLDLDAVRQLARASDGTWTLSFKLPDCQVCVDSDGEITVEAGAVVSPEQ